MYDLEIIVPVETGDPVIVKRIEDFKKFGLINLADQKVKVVLAASKDNDTKILEKGWDTKLDVEILVTPYKQVAQRIYHYYAEYAKPDTARWYMRVDEDSMTDIDTIVKTLDDRFDHLRDYHISGETNGDVVKVDHSILKTLGFESWYRMTPGGVEDSPQHEYEISVTSLATMNKILSNKKAKEYMKLRQEFAEGYGDHGLALCARMEKVYPVTTKFITKDPDFVNFSKFSGKRSHIHWTGRDKHYQINTWLELTEGNDISEYVNCTYLYGRGEAKHLIRLRPERFMELNPEHNHPYPSRAGIWGVTKEGKLTIFVDGDVKHNHPIIILEKEGNDLVFKDYRLKKL